MINFCLALVFRKCHISFKMAPVQEVWCLSLRGQGVILTGVGSSGHLSSYRVTLHCLLSSSQEPSKCLFFPTSLDESALSVRVLLASLILISGFIWSVRHRQIGHQIPSTRLRVDRVKSWMWTSTASTDLFFKMSWFRFLSKKRVPTLKENFEIYFLAPLPNVKSH